MRSDAQIIINTVILKFIIVSYTHWHWRGNPGIGGSRRHCQGGGGQEVLVYNSVYSTKRNSSTQVIFSCITLFSIAG